MHHFHCFQCSRNSMSAGTPRCLQCGYVEPRPTVADDSNPTEPEAPSQFGTASGSKNHPLPNDTQMTELFPTQNRKRKEEENQMIPDNSEGHFGASKVKRMRLVDDIRAVPGPSGFHQNNKTSNLSEEKSQYGSSLESQSETLTGEETFSSSFSENVETAKSVLEQDIHNSGKVGSTVLKKRVKPLPRCGTTSGSKNRLLPNDIETAELAPAHDRNRKEEKDQMLQDNSEGHFEASMVKRMRPVDDIRAVPGPSGFHQNKDASNLCEEKSQSGSSLEPQSVPITDEQFVICEICAWEMNKHDVEHEGKNLYKCCDCHYKCSRPCDLQRHASSHRPRYKRCKICGEFDFENSGHDSEQSCDVYKKKFQCRTRLEEHSLNYEEYFYVYCRNCRKRIDGHITGDQKRVYGCCKCDYSTASKSKLREHLYNHADLKLFKCDVCGRRYTLKASLLNHLRIHFKCKKCEKPFTSKVRLEVHFKKEHTQASADSKQLSADLLSCA